MITSLQFKSIRWEQFYTEGPLIDDQDNIYFTTLAGGKVMKMAVHDSTACVWVDLTCPNGQTITQEHTHICCDSQQAALFEYDKNGILINKIIDGRCAGEIIRVPNDVITDKKGNIYFTDSVRHEGKIGFIGNDGMERIVAHNLDYPNGLALSADEKTLYVAESYKNRVIAFTLSKEGTADNGFHILADLPSHPSGLMVRNLPDGLKVDHQGNLWVAHYGMGKIHVLTKEGHIKQSIEMPFDLPSNIYIKSNRLVVTGGYAEPGPGCVVEMEVRYE